MSVCFTFNVTFEKAFWMNTCACWVMLTDIVASWLLDVLTVSILLTWNDLIWQCRVYSVFCCPQVATNCVIYLTVYPPHVTQVPQDDWGGYPGDGKDDEIPCRRMRSSSYVKAMGDEESGESDSSPKTSPQKSVRPDALVKAIIRPRDLLDSQR